MHAHPARVDAAYKRRNAVHVVLKHFKQMHRVAQAVLHVCMTAMRQLCVSALQATCVHASMNACTSMRRTAGVCKHHAFAAAGSELCFREGETMNNKFQLPGRQARS